MILVSKYSPDEASVWNAFVEKAINGSFLFHRDFMDYHKDRFNDFSLLVYNNDKLQAVLPAHYNNDEIYSHQGLSYGGLLIDKCYLSDYFQLLEAVLLFLQKNNFKTLQLNPIPNIYHKSIASEIDYALFILKAKQVRADAYFVVNPNDYTINRNRKRALKVASENALELREHASFSSFWGILEANLKHRFEANPTHTLAEITQLYQKFPKEIKLFEVLQKDKVIAGAVLFLVNDVAHIQYSSADETREETGSMDFLFQTIIEKYANKKYISFGISGEEQGKYINTGLAYWKQSFGARIAVQQFYSIEIANHYLLKTVFR